MNYSWDRLAPTSTEHPAKRDSHTCVKLKNKLYKDILAVVPDFNPTINNYQINDIVKVKLINYDVVVETATGTTIETKTVGIIQQDRH